MTTASTIREDDQVQPEAESVTAAPRPRWRRRTLLLAALAGLVAVGCALALPFAPVRVNEPTVTWPRDPARPEPTLLTLSAYRPLAMDIRFTCDAARWAQASGGTVVATALPEFPEAIRYGLVVTAVDQRLRVHAFDRLVLDEPLGVDPCEFAITGESRGRPVLQPTAVESDDTGDDLDEDEATTPPPVRSSAFAAPDDALLVVTRDGVELARVEAEQLPDVELLTTSLTSLEPGSVELSVRLRLDDEFTSSPTPLKYALIVAVVAALVATAVLLAGIDRTVPRVPPRWGWAWPRLVDAVVPAAIVFWAFVAPATDDDGYYAAMARNSRLSGEVGNYYQLYDQNFTPFTWFYQALGWWQQVAGDAPVLQRVPAVVFGVLTWLALRRFAVAAMSEFAPTRKGVRSVAHAVLAVVFLSWWLPQDMGVRPEGVVALCGAVAMLAVLASYRRKRLLYGWFAVAVASLGFAAHPTGFTTLAPLLAGLPLLWSVIRSTGDPVGTALRALAVASGGMVGALMAFADGALRDFLRGQALFLSIQPQENWSDEIQRYLFLLSDIPMGNYAKRAAVLLCLVALVWFAALAAAARGRGVPVPVTLWFSGSATALGFAALWLTPSKWTHHFGALAGIGSAFLALLLVMAVPLTRQILGDSRLPVGVLAAAIGSTVPVLALAWRGPNQWPYAWMDGMWRANLPPAVGNLELGSPLLWLGVVAAVAVVLVVVGRLLGTRDARLNVLRAVPIVVVVSLASTSTYLLWTFGFAAADGVPASSVWARGLADPTGRQCGAAGVIRVLDPATARTLTPAVGLPAPPPPVGFVENGGYYPGHRPLGPAGLQTWGSLVSPDARPAEWTTGTVTTPWYELPPLVGDAAVTVLAAGSLSEGNQLRVEYGRRIDLVRGSGVLPIGTEELTDTARNPAWRTLRLDPPPGADLVRLVAVDQAGAVHGWLAFTAPAVLQPALLTEVLPAGAPIALAWQHAFNYPCQRQPAIVNGITEAPVAAVLWGRKTFEGFADGAAQPFRGGAFGQVARTQSVQQLLTVPPVDPNVQVYLFSTDLARDAYTVTTARRTVPGASVETR